MVSSDQLLDIGNKQMGGRLPGHQNDVTVSQKMLEEAAADKERVSEVLDRDRLVSSSPSSGQCLGSDAVF